MDEFSTFDTWLGPWPSKSNICIQSFLWLHRNHPQGGCHKRLSECCRVVSVEIALISLKRMSLAVLGREQSGMEAGWRRAAGNVGEGILLWMEKAGAVLQGPQTFVFLSHLWRGEKRGETRARSTVGAFGRTVTEVQASEMQRYKILPSLLTSWQLRFRPPDTKINKPCQKQMPESLVLPRLLDRWWPNIHLYNRFLHFSDVI